MSSGVLDKLGNKLIEYVNATEKFAQEQIPDLLEQIIVWEIASSLAMVIFGLVTLVAGIFLIAKVALPYFRLDRRTSDGEDVRAGGALILAILLFIFSAIDISSNTLSLTKALVAPKLVLLEKAQHLVSGNDCSQK